MTTAEQCKNNHKQVALAVLSYESANGTLPPLRLPRKFLSWRYTVLPFLEENGIYNPLQSSDEWEVVVEHGIAVGPARPAYVASYQCPTTPGVPLVVRSHIMATGASDGYKIFDALGQAHTFGPYHLHLLGPCAWFGPTRGTVVGDLTRPASLHRVVDGLSKTMLVFEKANLKYNVDSLIVGSTFLGPYDNSETGTSINSSKTSGLYSYHSPPGAHAAMCDGSVTFLPEDTPQDELLRLFLRADSETGIEVRWPE